VIQTSGPWPSVEHYRNERWDTEQDKFTGDDLEAEVIVMHLTSESIPRYLNDQRKTFIRHPDLTWHKIFVDDEVNVTAFSDWDGVDVNQASLGFCSYPSWLTHDWDPINYGYEDDGAASKDTVEESLPAELSRHRQHYSSVFEGLALPHYDPRETRLSHIVEAIEIAAGSQFNRDWIVFKVLVHAFHGKVPFDYRTFAKEYMT
jgi:hypothetical protein